MAAGSHILVAEMSEAAPVRVLIAGDQPDVLNALRLLLVDEGFDAVEARSAAEALERIEGTEFDLAIPATHFLTHYAAKYRKPLAGFDDRALALLGAHAWPGNVRELAHVIERAVLMADPGATSIAPRDLGLQPQRPAADAAPRSLEDAERRFIEKVLAEHGGDVRLAARQLGMSRSALYRRLQQYGVRE